MLDLEKYCVSGLNGLIYYEQLYSLTKLTYRPILHSTYTLHMNIGYCVLKIF